MLSSIPKIFAVKLWRCQKYRRIWHVSIDPRLFGGRGPANF